MENKSAYALMNSIMQIIVEIEELEFYLNDNQDDDARIKYDQLNDALVKEFEGLENKADSYAFLIDKLYHDIEFVKQQSSDFKRRAEIKTNKVEMIENRIKEVMINLNMKELSGQTHKLKLGKESISLSIDPLTESQLEALDNKYKESKTVTKVINSELKKDLLAGASMPFARLVYKQNLKVDKV